MRTSSRIGVFAASWALLAVSALVAGPEGEAEPLLPGDQAVLDDYSEAVKRFAGLSLPEFVAEYGPKKAYLESDGASFVRGDVNGDGNLNITDPICTLNALFVGDDECASGQCRDAMDSDDSGTLDITDTIFTFSYLFKGGREPPAPFPAAGVDPTPDAIECHGAASLGYDPRGAEHFDQISSEYPLSDLQMAAYTDRGFVIAGDRRFTSFFQGFKEIYARHLPVYISADALLDALHLSFDRMLLTIEEDHLSGQLNSMLRKMDGGIEALTRYAGGADIGASIDDVALWVCAARSLLAGTPAGCRRSVDPKVDLILSLIAAEQRTSFSIFGQDRDEDFSQFRPRGHYTRSEELKRYFRALMWIQRTRFDFTKHPRQAAGAFLLTRLLADTGATAEWNVLNGVIEAFVGASDSLNPVGMQALAQSAAIDSAGAFLDPVRYAAFVDAARQSGAGRQLILSQILLSNPYNPDGFTPIPAAFHFLGQRFIVDSFVFTNVVFDRVQNPDRLLPSPLDAWFVLGNRAALPLLQGELETYHYQKNLAAMDWIVSSYDDDFWTGNLYNLWLSALRTLHADTTSDRYPPVLRTIDWDRRMLHAQLASWAHLRHDTILYAKQSYTPPFCDYPDGWVDPYPDFFTRLADYAARVGPRFKELGLYKLPLGGLFEGYFLFLEKHSRMLASIAQAEVDQASFTEEQVRFLKGVLRAWRNCDQLLLFDGWYPQLIFNANGTNVEVFDPTIADVHTAILPGQQDPLILHVGVGYANLMILSIKNDCGHRAYAGPVLSYHELLDTERFTDEEWKARLEAGADAPRPAWTGPFVR